jgi:DNA-binding LacI/PurR family transcriptional regulator
MLVSHAASVDLGHHRVAQVDGYIQLGRGRNPSGLRDLAEAGVPLAVWAPVNPNNGFCTVGVDNVALARRAVEHLLAGGRRRIAIITADLDDETSEGFDRFEGYRQALEAAGLPQDDSLVEDLTNANHSGTAATSRLLDRHDDIDAVFAAASDSVAISVMRTLQDVGRRVPRDIGVVGFDNIQLTEFTSPRLTSIDQGLGDGAPLLVDQVMRQIDGERWQSREIPGRLVVRESTGGDLVDV